jgi:hypothetical protein
VTGSVLHGPSITNNSSNDSREPPARDKPRKFHELFVLRAAEQGEGMQPKVRLVQDIVSKLMGSIKSSAKTSALLVRLYPKVNQSACRSRPSMLYHTNTDINEMHIHNSPKITPLSGSHYNFAFPFFSSLTLIMNAGSSLSAYAWSISFLKCLAATCLNHQPRSPNM